MARHILINISRRAFHKTCRSTLGFRYVRGFCSEEKQSKSSSTNDKNQKIDKDEHSEGIKRQILDASLPFVQNHGWTQTTLCAGAESLGYPGVIHGLFPSGGVELVQHFYHVSNENLVKLLAAMVHEEESQKILVSPSKKIMYSGVEERLRMVVPYKQRWPEALALMSLPPNVPTALANLLTIVDDICHYAGDRSVDMTWYGRRLVLAGVYKTTELFLLSDSSADHQKTWEFLNRRLEEAVQLESYVKRSEEAGNFAKEFAAATFITARNILGLNWNR